jgi:hypothetical protein
MRTIATAPPAGRRRRLATVTRVAAPLAAVALLTACSGDEATPGASPSGAPSASATEDGTEVVTDPAAAAGIPLDGAGGSPVKWRETEVAADEAAVLAARRYVALQYTVLASPDPAELRRLFGTVTGGDLADVYADPSDSTRPPQQLSRGPLFAWVVAAEPQGDGSVQVEVCRDFGFSAEGTAPTARTREPVLTRFVVAQVAGAWRVTSEADPAESDPQWAECTGWAAGHTAPDSPA